MRPHQTLAFLAIAFALSVPVHAQESAAQLSPVVRAQVYELLSYQCGVAEVEDRFRLAVAELGPVTEPLFLLVLAEGVPAEVRRSVEDRAASRYDRRQAWLAENGKELFGEDTGRLAERSRADYVADVLRRLDALHRENAVRGLGIVGGAEAAAAVEAAVARDPDLAILVDRALNEIRRRQ